MSSAFVVALVAGSTIGVELIQARVLSYLERVHPRFIPWAWGLNGLTSVMASVLAVILAMRFGFDVVVMAGGVVYLAGSLAVLRHARRFATS